MKIEIITRKWDSDDVYIGKSGFGYVSKDCKSLGLIKCPKCSRGNYALNVSTGQCAWCAWELTFELHPCYHQLQPVPQWPEQPNLHYHGIQLCNNIHV